MGMSVFGGLPLDLSYLVFQAYPNFNTFLSLFLAVTLEAFDNRQADSAAT